MTKVFLIRHGETLWNKELKYQGHADIALSPIGLKQAKMAAEAMSAQPISAVYASDLSRAVATAEKIAERFELGVQQKTGLREISFGLWEGLTYTQIEEKWPGMAKQLFEDATSIEIPEGETFLAVQNRTLPVLEEIIAKNEGKTIAVVSHGAAIRTILCGLLEIPLRNLWKLRQDNTAINVIECFGEKRVVSRMNDTHHLGIADVLPADGTIPTAGK